MFDQTYNQGMGAPIGMGAPMGYMYQGMPQQQIKFHNTLTPEQIKSLQQQSQQFSLGLTSEEMLRAQCNHRNNEGTGDALIFDPVTNEATCTICGYKFKPVDSTMTPEQVEASVRDIQDILQTIKLLFIDLPPESSLEFFPIIALLDKVPKLFDYAVKNMAKHENSGWAYNNRNMGAINMFQNLQNILGGGMGMPQQPMMGGMGMPQQQPMMGGMGMPQQPMGANPFGYAGASQGMFGQQPGYTPQTTGFQYNPVTPTPAAPASAPSPTPAAPAPADTTVTQTVNA